MKFKVFNPLRNLLSKLVDNPAQEHAEPELYRAPAPRRGIVMGPRPTARPAAAPTQHHNGGGVEVPLQPILASLPPELRSRVLQHDPGPLTISIALEKVLAQLSRGAVHMSFGELRQAAPDCFTPENDRDRTLVMLPLGEVLARINPALITRRRAQKAVEVPEDIASPFDKQNRGLKVAVAPPKPPSGPPAGPLQPRRQVAVPGPAVTPSPARAGMTFAPTPKPPTATPLEAPAFTSAPAARIVPPPVNRPLPPATAAPITPLNPVAPAAPVAPVAPVALSPAASPAPAPARPAADSNPLFVALTALAESWPEAIRQELVQLNLLEARVAFPSHVAERALRQGRLAFTWKTLRSWIKPTPLPTVSAHDSAVLELPLKVVAPLFLAKQAEAGKSQRKVAIDEAIPDIFFSFPGAAAAAPVAPPAPEPPKPQDTNFYIWDDTSDTVREERTAIKPPPTPGTKFPAKYATPNEIVSRAAALDGVSGVLIALPDGLMVASRLSPELNGDTLAAFLPQIFGKLSQCTKELRMGELNNVAFTVGNIPWKIFRVNAIFFAALGRAGEPLPTAPLATLAAELDHKPK